MSTGWKDEAGSAPPTVPSTPPGWPVSGTSGRPPAFGEAPPVEPVPAAPGPPGGPSAARTWTIVAAILVVGLAIALVLFLTRRPENSSASPSTTTTTAPTTTTPRGSTPPTTQDPGSPSTTAPGPTTPAVPPATQAELDAAVRELRPFVERERGATFAGEVPVVAVDDAEYQKLAPVSFGSWKDELVRRATMLVPLGDLPPDTNAEALVTRQLSATVAFYDPEARRIVVRQRPMSPFLRGSLVRSLTRSLDEQRLGGDVPEVANQPDERAFGLESLRAGDAERIGRAWYETLAPTDRQSYDREAVATVLPPTEPSTFSTYADAPTRAGAGLVDNVVANGGVAALDAAFRSPPVTSAQVLHPERYLSREPLVPVANPTVEGKVLDRGMFGEALLGATLGAATDPETGRTASDGWAGDAFATWTDEERGTCIRVEVQMVDATAFTELVAALTAWKEKHPAAEVVPGGDRGVTITSCAPPAGGGGDSPL